MCFPFYNFFRIVPCFSFRFLLELLKLILTGVPKIFLGPSAENYSPKKKIMLGVYVHCGKEKTQDNFSNQQAYTLVSGLLNAEAL